MKAMVLSRIARVEEEPLELKDVKTRKPSSKEVLIRISSCGICHTEIDEIEGRRIPNFPIILGHEVIGYVERAGSKVSAFKIGDRVGVAWIYSVCGRCRFCKDGRENLCDDFKATGCDVDGGYAEYMTVNEDFVYPIPDAFSDLQAAPLMCAGAIGYRALKLTRMKDGDTLGLYGFGASAHIVIQLVRYLYPDSKVFVFTRRKGDEPSKLARDKGADWIGVTGEKPPEKLNCSIDTTPVGLPVKEALSNLEKGGRLVINAIRKETPIPELEYAKYLWNEKEIKSVANITRKDVGEFLTLSGEIPIKPEIRRFKLEEANKALIMLKHGRYRGAGVLMI